ncbi:hypothetical protein A3741_22815 [Oleiphilus sp. HI0069]|nr:hypothetical protein A3741_22815 [Oleiphilus sp. HI0069]
MECQSEEFECHTRVRFLGFVNEPRKVYAASDCFVLPSTYEGFGHVHLEANACGIPSIGFGTNPPEVITATEEIVEDGANGYVVRELGVEPLYEKMMSAVSVQLKEGRHLTASKCLDVVKSKYSWEQHAANILEIIND